MAHRIARRRARPRRRVYRAAAFALAAAVLLALGPGCASTPAPEPAPEAAGAPADDIFARIAAARAAADARPADPERQYRLGNLLFDVGRYAEAAEAYEAALALDAADARAWTNLGLAQRRMGRPDAALEAYERALALAPGDAVALRNAAVAAESAGDLARAGDYYARLAAADPEDTLALAEQGRLLMQQGAHAAAVQIYERLLLLDPGTPSDFYNLGVCHYALERWEYAETAWRKAVELQPNHVSANKGLAVLYWELGDYPRAWAMVARCQRLGIVLDRGFIEALQRDSGRTGPLDTRPASGGIVDAGDATSGAAAPEGLTPGGGTAPATRDW